MNNNLKNIVVVKYGGSSVSTKTKMKKISNLIKERVINNHQKVILVISAQGSTTNKLLKLANKYSSKPNIRELDVLISTGEQQSISLMSMILNDNNLKAISLTGYQANIKTYGLHTKNKIESINSNLFNDLLHNNDVIVVAGFQGVNEENEITTLGRGGSDTTAIAIASALNCDCYIYTDVNGIYTVDPRLYSNSKKLDFISFEEMIEMAVLGAKVMEPRAVEIAYNYNIKVYVGHA